MNLSFLPCIGINNLNITDITKSKTKENEVATTTEKACGSCYGAQFNETACCNTCEDVKEAYRMKKWSFPDLDTIEQCRNEHYSEKIKNAFKEGCRIHGSLEVNRVSIVLQVHMCAFLCNKSTTHEFLNKDL